MLASSATVIMDLKNKVRIFLVCVSLSFPNSDCKGCGQDLDFEVSEHVWNGNRVTGNAYPWIAFIYGFDRDVYGLDVRTLDLPNACKKKTSKWKNLWRLNY